MSRSFRSEAEAPYHLRCSVHISIRDNSRTCNNSIRLNRALAFQSLKMGWTDRESRVLLLVVSLFFSNFCFDSLRLLFQFRFFSNLRHHFPSVPHHFLFRQMPRRLFYGHWVQYERSPANTFNSCTDPLGFIRTAAAYRMGNRCTRSMGCKQMPCRAVPSNVNIWNAHLLGLK